MEKLIFDPYVSCLYGKLKGYKANTIGIEDIVIYSVSKLCDLAFTWVVGCSSHICTHLTCVKAVVKGPPTGLWVGQISLW